MVKNSDSKKKKKFRKIETRNKYKLCPYAYAKLAVKSRTMISLIRKK